MYSKELQELIDLVLADGVITEKERQVLYRRAQAEGVDIMELEVVLEGKLATMAGSGSGAATMPPPPPGMSRPFSPPPPPPEAYREYSEPEGGYRQSLKYGTIRKCPNCGAKIKGGDIRCRECLYEFVDVQAVRSVREFAHMINGIEAANPRMEDEDEDSISSRASAMTTAINNFPIPNSREDLLEFIVFFETRYKNHSISTKGDVAIMKAYKSKYIESVEKAKIYFGQDPEMGEILRRYEKNKRWSPRELSPKVRTLIIALLIYFLLIIFCLFLVDY